MGNKFLQHICHVWKPHIFRQEKEFYFMDEDLDNNVRNQKVEFISRYWIVIKNSLGRTSISSFGALIIEYVHRLKIVAQLPQSPGLN